MTFTDLARLIKQCNLSQVRKLKVGEVEVVFDRGDSPEQTTLPFNYNAEIKDVEFKPNINDNKLNEQLVDDETEYLENIKITDPLKYEELILKGDLDA